MFMLLLSVLLSVCLFFQNLATLPIDLYGSKIWEPLVLFITRITKKKKKRITQHKQHFVLLGRKDYILRELSPRFKSNKSPG